jgi:sn-glycerol 3-phosphate transport system ATP-binding protein
LGTARLDVSRYRDLIKRECSSSEVTLGIRPEDVEISHRRSSKTPIKVSVEAYEPLGSEAVIDTDLGGSLVRIISPITFTAKPGDEAYIRFNEGKIHIIDRKTEKVVL